MPLKIIQDDGEIFQYRVERKNSHDNVEMNDDKFRESRTNNDKSKRQQAQQQQQQQKPQQQSQEQNATPKQEQETQAKLTPKEKHDQKTQDQQMDDRLAGQETQGKRQHDTLIESGEFTQELYERYEFEKTAAPIYDSRSGKVLRCFDKQMPKLDLVVRIYYNGFWLRDEKLFITLLRRLGTDNPNILGVQQTFFTESKFCIIYEYAQHGSAYDYVLRYGNASLTEDRCQSWAKGIYQAMEYLKDISIAHRSICPKHIMLVCDKANNDIVAKLWGFRSAIALNSDNTHIMQLQPCWMFSSSAMFNFQAPEVFHNERSAYYDAIDADIWSFGATILFILTGHYPYPVLGLKKFTETELEKAIDDTLQQLPLSDDAREFFCAVLVPNPRKRLDFRRIAYIPWLNIHSADLSL